MDNITGLYLSRILSGYHIILHNSTRYKILYPGIDVKYEAEIYAQDEYEKNRFNDWIKNNEVVDYLVEAGLWSYDGDSILEKTEKTIEDLKVELYNNYLDSGRLKSIKRQLQNNKNLYNARYEARHLFDGLTLEGYANIIKNQFILLHSIYDINDNMIFNIDKDINYSLLNSISSYISQQTIDIGVFRQIARSDIWRNYWSANKENLFNKATINWTDEQKTLVVLTKMYDSAYENPECPVDQVFEDDDMFDGWMILQRRESEKSRAQSRSDKMLKDKKLDNASEVFLMANSKTHAQNIYGLNDNTSRSIISERDKNINKAAKEGKVLQEADLPDVQRDLLMQSNEHFKNRK